MVSLLKVRILNIIHKHLLKENNYNYQTIETRSGSSPPEQGGRGGVSPPPSPAKFSVDVPFLLMNPLNVLFLKELTKNIHENQQAKPRAS